MVEELCAASAAPYDPPLRAAAWSAGLLGGRPPEEATEVVEVLLLSADGGVKRVRSAAPAASG